VGRLKPREKNVLAEMTTNLVPPRNIMSTLKERDLDNGTAIKQVHKTRHRLKVKARGSTTEMQQLFLLEQNKYVFKCRTFDNFTI
jgi:hypothetical protein